MTKSENAYAACRSAGYQVVEMPLEEWKQMLGAKRGSSKRRWVAAGIKAEELERQIGELPNVLGVIDRDHTVYFCLPPQNNI